MSGSDTKVGIIVHEVTHCLLYVNDIVYGRSACRSLAQNDPPSAADNTDN